MSNGYHRMNSSERAKPSISYAQGQSLEINAPQLNWGPSTICRELECSECL